LKFLIVWLTLYMTVILTSYSKYEIIYTENTVKLIKKKSYSKGYSKAIEHLKAHAKQQGCSL